MSTWLSDMLSATPFGSMNLMYNQCYADSTARWYMNNPLVNNFMFTPYSFNMGLNPEFVWYQTGFNMFNNAGAWNVQQPYSPWGWYQQTTNNNNNNNNKVSEEEKEYEKEFKTLQELLKKLLIDEADGSTDALSAKGELLKSIDECTKKTTNKEKLDALKIVYNKYRDNGTLTDEMLEKYFLTDADFKISVGKLQTWLDSTGYEYSFKNDNGNASKIASSIKSQIDKLGNDQGNLQELDSLTPENVLRILSTYNSQNGDIIEAINNGISKINDPNNSNQRDSAKSSANRLAGVLINKASELKKELKDSESQTAIQTAIDDLNGKKIDGSDFKEAFYTLYALTRIAAAVVAKRGLRGQFAQVDITIADFIVENTIKDLKNEKILDESKIDELAGKIKETNNDAKKSAGAVREEDDIDTKLSKLVDIGYIEKEGSSTCEECQVYKEVYGNRYFIFATDGQIYKVTKTGDSYTKADAVQAKDIEAAGKKAKARKELEEDLAKLSGILSKTIGDNTVYTIKIAGEDFKFIIDGDNKLQEVIVSGTNVEAKSGVQAKTINEIKKVSVKDGNRKDNLKNLLDKKITLKRPNGKTRSAICDGHWNKNYNIGAFNNKVENALSRLAVKPEGSGFTDAEWHDAYENLLDYYNSVYTSLASEEWNKKVSERSKDHNTRGTVANCSFKVNNRYGKVNDFDDVYDGKSESGLYIGCNFNWLFINRFHFFLDGDTVFAKFKSFLPD